VTAQVYVNQIVKKVKCSRKKREEIRRQLLADMEAEIEQGVPLDVVMIRMGEPIAIAEEFNQNLPQQERKQYKRGRIKKAAAVIAVCLAALAFAVYWFLPVGVKFGSSGQFQQAAVEEQAKKVIHMINTGDYEALQAATDVRAQKILTKEVIEDAKRQAGTDWGEFREFGKCYFAEQKLRGSSQAVVQFNASYENIAVTYTLFFNPDLKLSGFYIK